MAWSIDIKSFVVLGNQDFIAIVPVWSEYSRQCMGRPVNQVRLKGVVVTSHQYNTARLWEGSNLWHPDNPYSQEKWIEVYLYLNKWGLNEYGQFVSRSRQNVRVIESGKFRLLDYRYFVPSALLIPLDRDKVSYKSADRQAFEEGRGVEAWQEMHSDAVMRSYY